MRFFLIQLENTIKADEPTTQKVYFSPELLVGIVITASNCRRNVTKSCLQKT